MWQDLKGCKAIEAPDWPKGCKVEIKAIAEKKLDVLEKKKQHLNSFISKAKADNLQSIDVFNNVELLKMKKQLEQRQETVRNV